MFVDEAVKQMWLPESLVVFRNIAYYLGKWGGTSALILKDKKDYVFG